MANYFLDSATGSDSDNGTTMDLAFATMTHALSGTSGISGPGDILWVRRSYNTILTNSISYTFGGARGNTFKVIGWPRASILNTTITSASWTNGSTTVDLVVGISLSKAAHCGRWATAPNGQKFLITGISDANTLTIDREYTGTTVTLTDGKFQIEADEDYALAQAIDDSTWTIKKATYNADSHDLAMVNFNSVSYFFQMDEAFCEIHNLNFYHGGGSTDAAILANTDEGKVIQGCIVSTGAIGWHGIKAWHTKIKRTIVTCGGTGTAVAVTSYGQTDISDSSFGYAGTGLSATSGECQLSNVNIGVELTNSVYDINTAVPVRGTDVNLGSTNKIKSDGLSYDVPSVSIENYQKVLGDHLFHSQLVEALSKDVLASSGDPYKRTGGADKILSVQCLLANYQKVCIFEHVFSASTGSRNYRYYVQCKDVSLTATELWIECEYVSDYDDTSEYTTVRVVSDEACSLRSGVSDWSQYIEVTGINPDIASNVRIKCYVEKYDANGYIFIDPKVVT